MPTASRVRIYRTTYATPLARILGVEISDDDEEGVTTALPPTAPSHTLPYLLPPTAPHTTPHHLPPLPHARCAGAATTAHWRYTTLFPSLYHARFPAHYLPAFRLARPHACCLTPRTFTYPPCLPLPSRVTPRSGTLACCLPPPATTCFSFPLLRSTIRATPALNRITPPFCQAFGLVRL